MSNGTFGIPDAKPFLISDYNRKRLTIVDAIRAKGRSVNILVRGKKGCGKSELAAQYAATRHAPLAIIPVGGLSEPRQIFGYMDLQDGKLVYRPGLFTKAIQTEGAVVHLEELNRPESDKALNTIFSVLDDQRRIWLDELADYLKVAAGVVFFATLNEGFEYIGTQPLDAALHNRFQIKLELGYLPTKEEVNLLMVREMVVTEVAYRIVATASALRNNSESPVDISTRDTLNMAMLVSHGLTVDEAFFTTVDADKPLMEKALMASHLSGEKGLQLPKAGMDSYSLL